MRVPSTKNWTGWVTSFFSYVNVRAWNFAFENERQARRSIICISVFFSKFENAKDKLKGTSGKNVWKTLLKLTYVIVGIQKRVVIKSF